MEATEKNSGEEVKRLQRCINDLISMMALPALWSGGDPSQIGRTLIDVLQRLLHLDLIYVRLDDPLGDEPIEMARGGRTASSVTNGRELGAELVQLLGSDSAKWPTRRVNFRFGDREMSIVPVRLGLRGGMDMLVAGAERSDFPSQTEVLLLRTAANHAAMALDEARSRNEQRRLADELEQRVANRTKELAAADRQLQLQVELLQLIPVAAWTLRPDGTTDFVNQNWLEYTGQSLEYVTSEAGAWMAMVHPDDREIASTSFWKGIGDGKDFAMETRIRRARDGAYRWHLNRAIALRDLEGKIIKFVGTSTDIQDLKRGEEALREGEQSLRLILDGIAGLVAIMSSTGEIEVVNQQTLKYFGKTTDQLKGWSTGAEVHPGDLPAVQSAWTRSVETRSVYDVDHRLRRADGAYRWFHARGLPLCDSEGHVLRWYVLLTDIDDRVQAQEALRDTQAELATMMRVMTVSQLTASIAHEVNQPLSGIITNAGTCLRMLDADPPNIDGARETARRTIRDGNRASEVITRLRALFSKRQTTTEQVDLNEATKEVLALAASRLQSNRIVLRSELAEDLPPVMGDRVQLQQVIMNLLQNASDAMNNVPDRSRQLLIQTSRDDADNVRLIVQDGGIGLDPQVISRLFDPFYTNKNDGMGIGLSVSRSIIENHGGEIWAKSNDGPGATFSFSIPSIEADKKELGVVRNLTGT